MLRMLFGTVILIYYLLRTLLTFHHHQFPNWNRVKKRFQLVGIKLMVQPVMSFTWRLPRMVSTAGLRRWKATAKCHTPKPDWPREKPTTSRLPLTPSQTGKCFTAASHLSKRWKSNKYAQRPPADDLSAVLKFPGIRKGEERGLIGSTTISSGSDILQK